MFNNIPQEIQLNVEPKCKKKVMFKSAFLLLAVCVLLCGVDLQSTQFKEFISFKSQIAHADVNVTSCEQLQGFAGAGSNLIDNPGETFLLQNNIDCEGALIEPIFPSGNKFLGTFEGNNFTISNFDVPSSNNASLFGYTSNSTIQNLTLDNIDVTCSTGGRCAVLVSDDESSTFTNIDISNVTVYQDGGQSNMGTVLAIGDGSQVSNITVNTATITCTGFYSGACQNMGGAIGLLYDNAGVQGLAQNITVTNANLYGKQYVGGVIGSLGYSNADNLTATSVTLGGTASVGGVVGYMLGSDGLEANLTNSSANTVHDPNSYFTAIGASTTTASDIGGLVGLSGNYTALNCGGETTTFTNSPLTSVSDLGGIVGEMSAIAASSADAANYTVQNCTSTGNLTGRNFIGGITGRSLEGRYDNVHSTTKIRLEGSSPNSIGGIIGFLDHASTVAPYGLTNCSYSGSIANNGSAAQNLGGLIGDMDNASVDSCTVDVFIENPEGVRIGGAIGQAGGSSSDDNFISNITVNATLYGEQYVGGMIGTSTYYLLDNISTSGSIRANPNVLTRYGGGVAGYTLGTSTGVYSRITNSNSSVLIRGFVQFSGGIVGYASYTPISKSFNTGDIEAYQGYTGGIVGQIQNGGAGYPMSEVYNTGNITGELNYIGGVIGYTTSSTPISNAYSTGSVAGGDFVGGLAGSGPNVTFTNSYSTGKVVGVDDFGGLVGGGNASTIATDSYWDTQTSKQSISYVGEGKTTEQMYTPATYSTWDSDTIWSVCNDNYPVLQSLGQTCPDLEPVVFEVNTHLDTSDDNLGNGVCADSEGRCSLRAAMQEHNALDNTGRENRITFNLSALNLTITLESSLPAVSGLYMNLDATTQSGYLGSPVVELDASNVTGSNSIFSFNNADNSSLQGLSLFGSTHDADTSIDIQNSDNFKLIGNYLGLNSLNEYAGTTLDLAVSIDNSDGVQVKNNTFANPLDIINSNNSSILDNIFELANTLVIDFAVQFRDGTNAYIFRNKFYNIARAIVVRDDSSPVDVVQNKIKENEGTDISLMIDLLDDANADTIGKNANDADDVDDGPNNLLNSPELSQITYDNASRTLTISGDFNSNDGSYIFDFYTSDGNDESRKYINFFVESVINKNLTFTNKSLFLPRRDVVPSYISATAQDEDGNTSEHSQLLAVDSIMITSCDQLAGGNPGAVANHIEDDYGAFYRLANDIDCSDYTGVTTFDPIGSSTAAENFSGVLVGDGYTISNLEISDDGNHIGLFAKTSTAIIQNLNFTNISINCNTDSSSNCGLITGYADQTSIEDVNVTQGVAPGSNPVGVNGLGSNTGGIAGYTRGSNYLNINSDIDVNGNTSARSYIGGIVGYTRQYLETNRGHVANTFHNVHSTGSVTGYTYTGGLIGGGQDVEVIDVSYSGTLTGYNNYIGGIAGQVTTASSSSIISIVKNADVNATLVSAGSGNLNSFGGAFGTTIGSSFENITVSGTLDATNYSRVGGVFGSLNGNAGYAANDTMSESLPVYVKNANSTLDITNATSTVGGIVGHGSYMRLSNINYSGEITHDSPGAVHSEFGGLIGYSTYIIVNGGSATSSLPISYAKSTSGGAFGNAMRLEVNGVSSDISLPAVETRGGGLIGSGSYINITNSYATGDVGDFNLQSGTSEIGGLLGTCQTGFCYISDSYATGNVEGDGIQNGGLIGELSSNDILVENSYATGQVSSTGTYTGGLIGYISTSSGTGTINNVYATGNVTSTGIGYFGALIGYHTSGTLNVNQSHATGNIQTGNTTGFSHCGGILAASAGTINIDESYSVGSYTCRALGSSASTHGFGGLVGAMDTGSIVDSYSHASITGEYDTASSSDDGHVGGLVGIITGISSITDSYSTGSLIVPYSPASPDDEVAIGGLVAEAPSATFTDSFWDTQTSGVLTSAGGTGKLTSEMKDQDTFTTSGVDWDFATTWEMCAGGGYPTHQSDNYCPLGDPFEFEVNTINDTEDAEIGDRTCLDNAGNCSLRAALQEVIYMQANESTDVNYNINFDISGGGPHTISLDGSLGYLPQLNGISGILINGESEPDYTSSPVIYVDASSLTTENQSVFNFDESSASSIRGIGVIGFQETEDAAFRIANSTNISLSNVSVGVNSDQTLDSTSTANSLSVLITNSSNSSIINSTFARPMDIISSSNSNTIQDNTFNLNYDTYTEGIYIQSSSGNTIESNVFDTAQVAIKINQVTGQTASTNTLTQNTAQNISSRVIELQLNGTPSANSNDTPQDPDVGANTLLNFPVIEDGEYDAVNDTLRLQGTVETANGADYYIEFFESDGSTDEALNYLGSSGMFTVSDNLYTFDVTLTGITDAPLNSTATLTDSDGNTSQHSSSQSLNDPPSDIQISVDNVDETAPGGAFDTGSVGTLTTTDGDLNDTHTYEILSIDGDPDGTEFSIGGFQSDQLIQNVPFDYETQTTYDVAIRTTDSKGVSYDETLTIQVNDINDNSPDLISETFNVAENNGAPSATLTVNDVDTVGTVSLTITGGVDQADFEISGTTLSFKDESLPLDYETKTQYLVEVTASDGVNADDTETFAFNVTDVDDIAPVITADQTGSVAETAAEDTVVVNVIATDSDTAGNLTNWQITSGDPSNAFQISTHPSNQKQGQITVLDPSAIDYETTQSYTLGIQVSDGTNISQIETVTIDVTDVNDNAPAITADQVGSIDENSNDSTSVLTVVATDPDTGTIFQNWQITGGTGQSLFDINSSTGEVTYNASGGQLNHEAQDTYALNLTVSDGTSTSSVESITINVTDINESPVFENQTVSINENLENGQLVIDLDATDPDIDTTLTYAIASGNTDVDDDSTLPFSINSETGQIVVADQDDLDYEQNTTFTLEVSATDDGTGNLSDTAIITINLLNQNDIAPVITTPGTFSIDEGQSSVAIIDSSDEDQIGGVSYSVSGGEDQTLFQIDIETNELTFINTPDFENPIDADGNNIYVVQITATDEADNSSTKLISIQIQDVAEQQPEQNQSGAGSSGSSSGGGGSISSPFTPNPNDSAAPEEDVEQDSEPTEPEQEGEPEVEDNPSEGQTEPDSENTDQEPSEPEQEDEPDVEDDPSEDQTEPDSEDTDPEPTEPEQEGQGSNSSGSASSGGSSSSPFEQDDPIQPLPTVSTISCDDIEAVDYTSFQYAQLDCDPLDENTPEDVDGPDIALAINLPQDRISSFPDEKIFITGKVFNSDGVDEVEVYAELQEGSSVALGRAEVDEFGNFSLLNKTSIPKDKNVNLKAIALREDGAVESPEYPVRLTQNGPAPIPTDIVSFVGKSASQMLNREDGYFTFVNTQDLQDGLELRVRSQYQTRHDVYWNSILIASSAITGSNSNQTVLYAPEEVIQDIEPFSSHKVTIVARSLENPNRKGIPQVINYVYIPSTTYYAGFGILALLVIVFAGRSFKRQRKSNPSRNQIT